MRTWKCEYCGRKNENERIDCRKCGCDRPEEGWYRTGGPVYGSTAGATHASFTSMVEYG